MVVIIFIFVFPATLLMNRLVGHSYVTANLYHSQGVTVAVSGADCHGGAFQVFYDPGFMTSMSAPSVPLAFK